MDADRLDLTGTEFAVAESIGHYGIARDGTLWYVLGPTDRSIPVLLDRRGRPHEIVVGAIDEYEFSNPTSRLTGTASSSG